jgi:hypothetical protein
MNTTTFPATATARPTRAQATSAWKLAARLGHLWAVSIARGEAVRRLMAGQSLVDLLPVDDGYTPPGVAAPTMEGESVRHNSGSMSIRYTIDRRGVVRVNVHLRVGYPTPLRDGQLFARVEIDPGTGRVEVEADGLHFENHQGEWRFAASAGRVAPPNVIPTHQSEAARGQHAAGCVAAVLGAFGITAPRHIAKAGAMYDARCVAAFEADPANA